QFLLLGVHRLRLDDREAVLRGAGADGSEQRKGCGGGLHGVLPLTARRCVPRRILAPSRTGRNARSLPPVDLAVNPALDLIEQAAALRHPAELARAFAAHAAVRPK